MVGGTSNEGRAEKEQFRSAAVRQLLRVPYSILFPLILVICLIDSYVINNSRVDLFLMGLLGVLGYFLRKFGYEPAPLVLALVLTPLLENALRQSLVLSAGSFKILLTRSICGGCLLIAAVLFLGGALPFLSKKRGKILAEGEEAI